MNRIHSLRCRLVKPQGTSPWYYCPFSRVGCSFFSLALETTIVVWRQDKSCVNEARGNLADLVRRLPGPPPIATTELHDLGDVEASPNTLPDVVQRAHSFVEVDLVSEEKVVKPFHITVPLINRSPASADVQVRNDRRKKTLVVVLLDQLVDGIFCKFRCSWVQVRHLEFSTGIKEHKVVGGHG